MNMPYPSLRSPRCFRSPLACMALGAALLAPSANAQQTVAVRAAPIRVTVADSAANSFNVTNYVAIGNYANPVTLGFSGLPAGASGSLDVTTFTGSAGANLTLNTLNVAEGEYLIPLAASGGANSTFLFTLQSGRMWNGATNVVTSWASTGSWVGGVVPGASDDVLFTQLGAQTNSAAGFTNSIVDADTEIASLRFSQTNGGARYHTLLIDAGRTLSVTGNKGLSLSRDWTGVGAQMDVFFTGPQGKLAVSNNNANIAVAIDNQQTHRLDLSGLGNFAADVNRIGLGDYTLFPQYSTLSSNGFGGSLPFLRPRRFVPTVRLARTNLVRAVYQDPTGFTNTPARIYGLMLGNNETAGTSTACNFNLGITNAFFLDSLCFAGFGSQGVVNFNTAFAATNPAAVFRGTNGGRMSMFCLGDANGPGSAGGNIKMTADFGSSNGRIDALVDKLYISRDRQYGNDYNTDCNLVMGQGVFDVNTVVVGVQENPGQTNRAYPRGQIIVSNGVFRVNNSIELGYTTEDPANTASQVYNCNGRVTVGAGGTMMANRILVGGVTKASTGNNISVNNGSTLIVSNNIAGADMKLGSLTLNNGSTLMLHVDCALTDPYVFTTNIVTSGTLNNVQIAQIANLASVTVPLITFDSGSPIFNPPVMPAGLNGALLTSNNVIFLVINTNAPKHLAWRGSVSADWDMSTKNWLDLDTSAITNFALGDEVVFDDTASAPKSVNLVSAAALIPGKVTMTNTTYAYTITGAGSLQGSATFQKWGANTLTIDAVTTLPVLLKEGSLIGTLLGAVGSADVAAGTTMNFSGAISAGVSVTGAATCSGAVGGTVSLLSPSGTFTNLGTSFAAGLSVQQGTLFHNGGSMNILGSPTIVTNALFVNAGNLSADRLTVNGTLKDLGLGTITLHAGALGNLTIAFGGNFLPGGDLTGTSTVTSDGSCSGTQCFPGRVLFASGSTNVFKVDISVAATNNTFFKSGYQDFGPSQGTPAYNGGTLRIVNIGTGSFAAGQSFKMFGNDLNGGDIYVTGTATNSYPVMDPVVPGPGLRWDLTRLIPGGIIGIIGVPTAPTNVNVAISFLTTISTNVPPVTNRYTISTLSWPSEYTGWRLEQQQNPMNIGISTNWATVFGSIATNQMSITNVIDKDGNSGFFRLVYP